MRSLILSAFVAVLMTVVSCQKPMDQEQVPGPFGSKLDNARLACTYTTLSGTISTNTTLSASNIYLLSGCVRVSSGVTLTIPAGTVLHGEQSTKGALIIERGASLIANGTSANPIVFTSDQATRAAGDWRGIVLIGDATINVASPFITRCSVNYPVGGSNDAHNGGSLKHIQIHYAGYTTGTENYSSGLALAAVGTGTTVENIQVSNSLKDGIAYYGGTVNSKYVASYDSYKTDFLMDAGYRGKMQFALAMRKSSSANDGTTTFSNGLLVQNDNAGSSNTPRTNPVISDMTILGPGYCGATGLSSNFKNAVLFTNNAMGNFYNGVISGWPIGLFYEGANTVANANSAGTLTWHYNTFFGYASAATRFGFNNGSTWNAAGSPCTTTQPNFITNPSALLCASKGYQALSSGLGHAASVCGDYCTTAPNFAISGSSLSASNYTDAVVSSAFFDTTAKPRGAFSTATAWTSTMNFCSQNTSYCP
jgi:hypothetical protein